MAFAPPIATEQEAGELGKVLSSAALTLASIRVRTYLTGKTSPSNLTNENASDGLKEVVVSIAARLTTLNPSLAGGVQSEGADGVSVTFGWDAWQGISTLVKGEEKALDALFKRMPFTIASGV